LIAGAGGGGVAFLLLLACLALLLIRRRRTKKGAEAAVVSPSSSPPNHVDQDFAQFHATNPMQLTIKVKPEASKELEEEEPKLPSSTDLAKAEDGHNFTAINPMQIQRMGEWREKTSKSSGKVYYVNSATGERSSLNPAEKKEAFSAASPRSRDKALGNESPKKRATSRADPE
jgi:hypothetical protein